MYPEKVSGPWLRSIVSWTKNDNLVTYLIDVVLALILTEVILSYDKGTSLLNIMYRIYIPCLGFGRIRRKNYFLTQKLIRRFMKPFWQNFWYFQWF